MQRRTLDLYAETGDVTRLARLWGIHDQSVTVEQEPSLLQPLPVVTVHGPYGGEKFRFTATRAALESFARELLAHLRKECTD